MKVEGFFTDLGQANRVVQQLQAAGVRAGVDMNDRYREDNRNQEINVAGTSEGPSLSSLVLDSSDAGLSVLSAASPMVSGYGRFDEIAGVNCKVVANVEPEQADEVRAIIWSMQGELREDNS